jgi:hypothetical protein
MATKLLLTGAGPFESPVVVDYLGLAYPLSGTSLQLRFAFEDGTELHLPIVGKAFDKLATQLAASRTNNDQK